MRLSWDSGMGGFLTLIGPDEGALLVEFVTDGSWSMPDVTSSELTSLSGRDF